MTHHCDNCTKPFTPPPTAPHKRFCSGQCRDEWHAKRRRKALDKLAELEKTSQPKE